MSHAPGWRRVASALQVSAVVKVHKLPEVQSFGAYIFPDYPTGVKFLRELYLKPPLSPSLSSFCGAHPYQ